MAGTLVSSVISDGVNSTSTTNAIQGSAKAWVNFNGTNGVIRASYNVSSITRNGTGDYTVNFTNALADGNYAVAQTNGSDTGGSGWGTAAIRNYAAVPTSTAVRIGCLSYTTWADSLFITCAVFR